MTDTRRPPAKPGKVPAAAGTGQPPPVRRRMPMADRRAQFLEAAIGLFAEHGFSANTRMLADRLGITQPLLFRYFPNKDALLQAVLQELYDRQLQINWSLMLGDRSTSLKSRLVRFSTRYAAEVYDHDWIRIYMFAGLQDGDFNRKYIANVTEPILYMIADEIRREVAPSLPRDEPVSREEIEYLWLYHGGLYYHAIRKHVYGLSVDESMLRHLVELSVDNLIDGMRRLLNRKSAEAAAGDHKLPGQVRSP